MQATPNDSRNPETTVDLLSELLAASKALAFRFEVEGRTWCSACLNSRLAGAVELPHSPSCPAGRVLRIVTACEAAVGEAKRAEVAAKARIAAFDPDFVDGYKICLDPEYQHDVDVRA